MKKNQKGKIKMKSIRNDKIPVKYLMKEAAYFIAHSSKPYKETIKIDKKDTQIIAHRGLSGIEMENTMPAFELACNHSYYGIETDVHVTNDGKYVIIHDDTTKRVSNTNFTVEQTDFDTLRSLELISPYGKKSTEYYIPTLVEYIRICKKHNKKCILELKNHFEEECVVEIVKIIESEGYLADTVFISFDMPNLICLKKNFPNTVAQYLTFILYEGLVDTLVENKLDLDIYYRELNKARIDLLHEKGIKVNCWTVNSKGAAQKLADWGVDYITTNIIE